MSKAVKLPRYLVSIPGQNTELNLVSDPETARREQLR
jgi:hypothetical protein